MNDTDADSAGQSIRLYDRQMTPGPVTVLISTPDAHLSENMRFALECPQEQAPGDFSGISWELFVRRSGDALLVSALESLRAGANVHRRWLVSVARSRTGADDAWAHVGGRGPVPEPAWCGSDFRYAPGVESMEIVQALAGFWLSEPLP